MERFDAQAGSSLEHPAHDGGSPANGDGGAAPAPTSDVAHAEERSVSIIPDAHATDPAAGATPVTGDDAAASAVREMLPAEEEREALPAADGFEAFPTAGQLEASQLTAGPELPPAGQAPPPPLVHDEVPALAVHDEVPALAVHDEVPALAVHDETPALGVHDEMPAPAVHDDALPPGAEPEAEPHAEAGKALPQGADTTPVLSGYGFAEPAVEGGGLGDMPGGGAALAPTAAGPDLAPQERAASAASEAAPDADVSATKASVAEASTTEASVAEGSPTEAPVAAASGEAGTPETADSPVGGQPAAQLPEGTAPPRGAPRTAPPSPAAEEKRRRAEAAWQRAVAAHESGETLTGSVFAAVKGGLLVDVGGVRGFLPASQTRAPDGGALESLVKTRVPVKVIDVDTARKRIVVSHRRAVNEERRVQRAELQASLRVGEVRDAVVVRLTDFGAFVDLGGLDALIPMRELAFERVDKASDVVSIGDRLPVEVVRIEEGGKKIAVSRKNALPDPWRDHAELIRHGNVVEGRVVAKDPRLEVELAPGVVGTIRESDADPKDYELGEAVEVSVQFVDRRTRRIRLTTMHAAAPTAAPQPWKGSGFAPLGVELRRRT